MGKSRKIYFSSKALKKTAKDNGITLQELSEKTGVSYNTLLYCTKQNKIMPDILEALAEYLDVDIRFLTGESHFPGTYSDGKMEKVYHDGSDLFAAWLGTVTPVIFNYAFDDKSPGSFYEYTLEECEKDFSDIRQLSGLDPIAWEKYLQAECIHFIEMEKSKIYNLKNTIESLKKEGKEQEASALAERYFNYFRSV